MGTTATLREATQTWLANPVTGSRTAQPMRWQNVFLTGEQLQYCRDDIKPTKLHVLRILVSSILLKSVKAKTQDMTETGGHLNFFSAFIPYFRINDLWILNFPFLYFPFRFKSCLNISGHKTLSSRCQSDISPGNCHPEPEEIFYSFCSPSDILTKLNYLPKFDCKMQNWGSKKGCCIRFADPKGCEVHNKCWETKKHYFERLQQIFQSI